MFIYSIGFGCNLSKNIQHSLKCFIIYNASRINIFEHQLGYEYDCMVCMFRI